MSDDRLTLARFERILDAFGAEPDNWPAAERARAIALLAGSLPARRALKQAQLLDHTLSQSDVVQPDPFAADRMAALLTRAPQLQPFRGPMALLADWLGVELKPALVWPQAIGLVAATLFGFYLGATGPQTSDTSAQDFAPTVETAL